MSRDEPGRVSLALARRGYNADRDVIERIAAAEDPDAALDRVVSAAPADALLLSIDQVGDAVDGSDARGETTNSTVDNSHRIRSQSRNSPPEEKGVKPRGAPDAPPGDAPDAPPGDAFDESLTEPEAMASVVTDGAAAVAATATVDRSPEPARVIGDVTGESTCTGEYGDFVSLFRDRYERLSGTLRGRVDHRPAEAIDSMAPGSTAAIVGLVNDVRSTSGGHRLVELEDGTGAFPCIVTRDRGLPVEELVMDELVAIEGTLSDDRGVLFADELRFPDIPRQNRPSTADRAVEAALVSDVHVGSREFVGDAWERFADWLHTPAAASIEYLLIAGDMVEGVGVYPGQDEDLSIVDIYDQYAAFSERLKSVPGDLEIVMIPGNHDAVRLAEPQPAFDEELRDVMRAHDARIVGNPSTVTVEGVSVLMYHGVSLDEIIARLPGASYDAPAEAMCQLLKKRHLAPTFGGRTQIAPEKRDYLVVDEIPDVLHAGHVHTIGVAGYRGVTVVNSGCWQSQTEFQRRNNIQPDYGYAPILDLQTLDVTLRKFT